MQRLGQFAEYLIEHKPALADTLALSLDDNIREVIEQGSREVEVGKFLPIEDILND